MRFYKDDFHTFLFAQHFWRSMIDDGTNNINREDGLPWKTKRFEIMINQAVAVYANACNISLLGYICVRFNNT